VAGENATVQMTAHNASVRSDGLYRARSYPIGTNQRERDEAFENAAVEVISNSFNETHLTPAELPRTLQFNVDGKMFRN
jgi:hypothetical protein